MARLPRISAPQYYYHIFSRGNNREPIFFENSDYGRFINNLDRFQQKYRYHLYAYCLLPNHFHLLLRPGKIDLSKIMQTLITAYSMYANKKHHHVGHVFQGRFKSIIVEKDEYLLQVLRYIYLNPVRAGLVNVIEEYPWSSYVKYFVTESKNPIIESEEILQMFSNDHLHAKKLFREFVEAGLGVDFDPEKEQVRGILGKARFRQGLTKVLKGIRI